MHLSVVTPEGSIIESSCRSLSVHAYDGSMGILPGHAPLVTELGAGLLVADTEGASEEVVLAGGYLQILDDKVTVLATGAWRLGEIDPAAASAELDAALAMIANSDDEFESRERAIARARALITHSN